MMATTEDQIQSLPNKTEEAYKRIQKYILKTPLLHCKYLSGTANVYFKLESEQVTGSVKARGSINKILSLLETDTTIFDKGIVTASSGNHGIACAYMADIFGFNVTVYCRHEASKSKIESLKFHGADVSLYGHDYVDAAVAASEQAKNTGQICIYPDWNTMAGHGTIGYEIYDALPTVDSVFVSVGGGGVIGGIAAYLKSRNSQIEVVGCSALNSNVMHQSVRTGRLLQVESMDTLSDGTAGGVGEDSVTFPVCCRHVDRWVDVTEAQIGTAVYWMLDKHHKVVEGAAGVALAAYMTDADKYAGKNVVILMCGSGIGPATLKHILDKYGPENCEIH